MPPGSFGCLGLLAGYLSSLLYILLGLVIASGLNEDRVVEWKVLSTRPSHFKAQDFKDPFLPDALGNFEAFIFVAVFLTFFKQVSS